MAVLRAIDLPFVGISLKVSMSELPNTHYLADGTQRFRKMLAACHEWYG